MGEELQRDLPVSYLKTESSTCPGTAEWKDIQKPKSLQGPIDVHQLCHFLALPDSL